MRKLRPEKIKYVFQGHTINKQQSYIPNSCSPVKESVLLSTMSWASQDSLSKKLCLESLTIWLKDAAP